MGTSWILLRFGVLFGVVLAANGDAVVTIQLLTYTNPSFGLASDNYYCAYLSPNVPPPPNPRGTVPSLRGPQQNGFVINGQRQPQPQRPPQYPNQQQPQQQYPQQQPGHNPQQNQQYLQNIRPGVPGGGYVPYGSGAPNQQQYHQGQQQQQQQGQQSPPYYPQNSLQQQQHYQPGQPQYQQPQAQHQSYQQAQQQNNPRYQQQQHNQYYYQDTFPGQQQCQVSVRDFNQPNWNECKFSFATVFSTFGNEPQVITTGLISLPSQNATIDFTQTTWNDKCTWGDCNDRTWVVPQIKSFKVKPNIIEIIVTHFGDSVWRSNDGTYTSVGNDQAHVVDTITVDISRLVPAAANVNPPQVYSVCVNGDQQQNGSPLSTLQLAISVQCNSSYFGSFCNMTNCTTYDNNTQVCASSMYPGQFLACNYDNVNMQPVNCTMCPYGVDRGTCRTLDSLVRTDSANLTGYIVGISILAILLAIAIIIIIVGAVTYRKHDNQPPRRNQPQSSTTAPTGWFGTKTQKNPTNGSSAPTRAGYTQAASDEPADSEWIQPPRRNPVAIHESQQQTSPTRPYNFPPPPARAPPSSASTPENGSRREAAV